MHRKANLTSYQENFEQNGMSVYDNIINVYMYHKYLSS